MKINAIFTTIAVFALLACSSIPASMAKEETQTGNSSNDRTVATAADLTEKLKSVANGRLDFEESRRLVQSAGQGGRLDLSPQLKLVAESVSETKHGKVAFDALYSLWLLDEPKTFFLETVKDHGTKPFLACYSIFILAYDPTDDVGEKLSKIERESTNNAVLGTIAQFRRVQEASRKYSQMASIEEKLVLLTQCLRTGWSQLGVLEWDPSSNLHPITVWAKGQISQLGEQQPGSVARWIFSLNTFNKLPEIYLDGMPENSINSFKDYLLRFVGDNAKAEYQKLRK
jgi:hypothetical protein